MNIILTRPLIEIEDLMGKLFTMGHKIIHIPTLKISSKHNKNIDIRNFDSIIFTSANAIRNFKTDNEKKNIICYCVGSITEKIARSHGFTKTYSAGGTVHALKNLIMNSSDLNEKSKIAYICGDNISYELDKELNKEGLNVKKIINYSSQKITNLNDENKRLIEKYPPDLIFVYSLRSAESFNEIVKEHSLSSMMTQSIVKCISKNICDFFKNAGWNKIEIFNTGDEILELEKYNK